LSNNLKIGTYWIAKFQREETPRNQPRQHGPRQAENAGISPKDPSSAHNPPKTNHIQPGKELVIQQRVS